MSLKHMNEVDLHTVAVCWSQPVHLCVRAQSHISQQGEGGMSVRPSKGWSEPQNTGSHTAEYLWCHRSDPNINGTVTSPGCVHLVSRNPGVRISRLTLLSSGECGWMVVLHFLFFCPPTTQSIWDPSYYVFWILCCFILHAAPWHWACFKWMKSFL